MQDKAERWYITGIEKMLVDRGVEGISVEQVEAGSGLPRVKIVLDQAPSDVSVALIEDFVQESDKHFAKGSPGGWPARKVLVTERHGHHVGIWWCRKRRIWFCTAGDGTEEMEAINFFGTLQGAVEHTYKV